MPATTSYQAGVEANQLVLSYAPETVYGVAPATAFTALRTTGESLKDTKTRQRPSEINTTRQAQAAVTTQESAGGTVNFALSYGTFDDIIATVLGGDWSTQNVVGASGDISAVPSVPGTAFPQFTSTTSGKFANIPLGTWIRTSGFSNSANNGLFYVINQGPGVLQVMVPTGDLVAETPTGNAAAVKTSFVRNGTAFKSLFLQKRFGSALFLQYPGSYIANFMLSGGVGKFMSGSFDVLAKQEVNATSDASTGGVVAAPAGRVHDSIGGFGGVYVTGAPIGATVDSFDFTVQNTGAAQQFGMGSTAAQGMLAGTLEVSGNLKVFFKDFSLYSSFKSEAQFPLSFLTRDPAGNAYVFDIPVATLMNPQILAGGPNQAVYAQFAIEGGPGGGGNATPYTFQATRIAAL